MAHTSSSFDVVEMPKQLETEGFSERKFWHKLTTYARVAGVGVLRPALRLYYAARDRDTPMWARRTIILALAYFVLPMDSLPDFLPALGYTDDLSILLAALTSVAMHIKPEHKAKSDVVLRRWFSVESTEDEEAASS